MHAIVSTMRTALELLTMALWDLQLRIKTIPAKPRNVSA